MSNSSSRLQGTKQIYASILSKNLGKTIISQEDLKQADDFTVEHIANSYSDDLAHKKRLKHYLSHKYFWPSTPIVANLPISGQPYTGSPIACFLLEVNQNNLAEMLYALATITKLGGGLGILLDVPTMSESSTNNKNYGFISIIKNLSLTMRINAGKARDSGSVAFYMRIDHGDIERFITMRQNKIDTDPEQYIPSYVHHGVIITDAFLDAVKNNTPWDLNDSKGKTIKTVNPRDLLTKIAQVRYETGEPFILFIDNANRANSICNKVLNLPIKTSNLCTEILLPTGKDHKNQERIAICCLGSINLTARKHWLPIQKQFIKDILRMYDNIITYFITQTTKYNVGDLITEDIKPGYLHKYKHLEKESVENAIYRNHPMAPALYAAYRSRDLGIGVCGLSRYLANLGLVIDDPEAQSIEQEIFASLQKDFQKVNDELGEEYGYCPDVIDYNKKVDQNQKLSNRFVNVTAIAPTSTLSIACDTSRSIEPEFACSIHKSAAGSVALIHPIISKYLHKQGIHDINAQIKYIHEHGDKLPANIRIHIRPPYGIPQKTIIQAAAYRSEFINQSQSVNLYYCHNVTPGKMIKDMVMAGRLSVKTLYYSFNTPAMDTQEYRGNLVNQNKKNNQTAAYTMKTNNLQICGKNAAQPHKQDNSSDAHKHQANVKHNAQRFQFCEIISNQGECLSCQ